MIRPLPFIAYKVMALVMSIMASLGMISTPSQDTPITVDETAQLSFVVWGDTQVSNYLFERAANLKASCDDLKNTQGKLQWFL